MHSMQKIVSLLSRAHGTLLGNQVANALDAGDFSTLGPLLKKVGPASEFADKQVAALLSKTEGLDIGLDTKAEAEKTFLRCEKSCRETNIRLTRYVNWFENGFYGTDFDLLLYGKISRIRKRIADILGGIPDLTPRFSNGSTFHDRGESVTLPHKMGSELCSTPAFEELGLMEIIRQTKWWESATGHITVAGNRFSTVPKNFKTERGICIEPSANLSLQLAVGQYIRRCLYSVDIEIDGVGNRNAQWLHKQLAKFGSLDDIIGTIDLSDASDTIAEMLVRLLLPRQWFALLSALRSPQTLFKGGWVRLSKFSSMGNGFTFELETLLFYAIAVEAAAWAKAYGDDLIVPSSKGARVVEDLRFFGFTPNVEKTFLNGSFKESCGGDYLNGVDTRPVYLKSIPADPLEWINLYNSVCLMEEKSLRNSTLLADSPLAHEAKRLIVDQIPNAVRLRVPFGRSGGLWDRNPKNWKTRPARVLRKKRSFYWGVGLAEHDRGYDEIKSVVPMSRVIRLSTFDPNAQFASALLGAPSKGVTPRDGTCGFKIAWLT